MESLLGPQSRRLARGAESRPEALRLDRGARHELLPGDPVGKTHVVLDARAGTGLPPDSHRVEGHGVEAFGRPVHRRRQAGGARADHDEVEQGSGHGPEGETEVLGEFPGRGMAQYRRAGDDRRRIARAQPHAGENHVGVDRVLEVDPLVGEMGPRREGAQRHRVRGVPRPDDPDGPSAVAGAENCRRARNALKIRSARSGLALMSRRKSSSAVSAAPVRTR